MGDQLHITLADMNMLQFVLILGTSIPFIATMPFVIEGEDYQDVVLLENEPEPQRYLSPDEYIRERRDSPPVYGAPSYSPPAPTYGRPPGRVGPVYTFVKTDPEGNFKWGVRHRAGSEYGR